MVAVYDKDARFARGRPRQLETGLDRLQTVFLIDDHPVVALGFRIALAGAETLTLIGLATEPDHGLRAIELARPDCLVLDLVFDGIVAFSLIARARQILPLAAIVVFSSLPARLYARDAQEAGADAYLGKNADMAELVRLIGSFSAERAIRTESPAGTSSPATQDQLTVDGVHMTPRELQIASSIGRGLSVEMIALEFDLSPRTISAHRENIRRKLRCRDSKELVARLARLKGADDRKS